MSKFYDRIIDTSNEVGKVFESFENYQTVQVWKEIQTEFHEKIEEDYPAIRLDLDNNLAEEKNPIPERLAKRIKVTTLLLGVMVIGGKYTRKLYLNAVEFCTMSDLNRRKFVQEFSS